MQLQYVEIRCAVLLLTQPFLGLQNIGRRGSCIEFEPCHMDNWNIAVLGSKVNQGSAQQFSIGFFQVIKKGFARW